MSRIETEKKLEKLFATNVREGESSDTFDVAMHNVNAV